MRIRRIVLACMVLLACSHSARAAITRVQKTCGSSTGVPLASLSTSSFGSSVTSGHLITVGVRAENAGVNINPALTDTLGSTWTKRLDYRATDPNMFIFDAVLASGGTEAVTVSFGDEPSYAWLCAVEVSGQAASPYDVAVINNGSATTTLDSGSITTAQAQEYVVLFGSQGAFATYTAANDSAGNAWTLVDGNIGPSVGSQFGGIEELITASALSADTAHLTSDTSAAYTVAVVAYKAVAGATPTCNHGLIGGGVGCGH